MIRVGALRRAVFARHANPWSAWSRWATTPLILVPAWRRSWCDAVLVATWFAVNPVAFPRPADRSAWSTRAMLGEEQWIIARPRDLALAVAAAATAALTTALVNARRRRPLPTAIAIAAAMILILGYWALMARYFDRRSAVPTTETAMRA